MALALVMALGVTTAAWADGATLEVGEGKAYATVQAAIDAANTGDIIQIAAGEYDAFIVSKPLTIVGTKENGVNKTVIKTMYEGSPTWSTGGIGCNSGGILIHVNGGTVTLRDLNVVSKGVNTSGNWFSSPICNNPTNDGVVPDTIVLDGCNVTYEGAADGAKGIAMMLCVSSMKMTGCTIEGFNTGWASMNDNLKLGTVELTGNTIRANVEPISGYWGAPADENGGNMMITDNQFEGTGDDAAMITLWDYSVTNGKDSTIKNLTVKDNGSKNTVTVVKDMGAKDNEITDPVVEDSVFTAGTFNFDPTTETVTEVAAAKSVASTESDNGGKLYHVGDSITEAAADTGNITVVKAGTESITVPENTVVKNDTDSSITVNGQTVAAGKDLTVVKQPRYYYNSTTTDTKADGTKGSPKTFDAGMGVYALAAVLSVTGMAYVGKKKF